MNRNINHINKYQILIFVIYVFPFVTILRFNSFVLQVESFVFLFVFASLLINGLKGKYLLDIRTREKKYQIIFVFVILFTSVFSMIYVSSTISSQLEDLFYWCMSFTPLIIYSKNELTFDSLLKSLLISSVVSILILLSMRTGIRGMGFINNANLAGSLFYISSLVCLASFFDKKNYIYLLGFVIGLIGIIATGSRESLVSFIIGVIIFISLSFSNGFKNSFKSIVLLMIFAYLSYQILSNRFPEVLNRYNVTIQNILSKDKELMNFAFANRLGLFEGLFNWIKSNPIKPLGFQGLRTLPIYGNYAHNMFMQSYVIGSIFGFTSFLIFLISLFKELINMKKKSTDLFINVLISIFIGYVVTGVVSDHFLNFFTWNYIYFTLLRSYKDYKILKEN